MLRAAILRAEQVVHARFGGTEPRRGVASRQHVLLDAKSGNVKTMDHILRGHDHLDVAADGNVQFVDFALSLHMFELPHPLFSDHVDWSRIPGRRSFLEENERTPGEDDHKDSQRNHRPGNLQSRRTFDLLSLASGLTPITQREHHDHRKNGHAHESAEQNQKNVERIYIPRPGRGSRWPKWKIIEHGLDSSL